MDGRIRRFLGNCIKKKTRNCTKERTGKANKKLLFSVVFASSSGLYFEHISSLSSSLRGTSRPTHQSSPLFPVSFRLLEVRNVRSGGATASTRERARRRRLRNGRRGGPWRPGGAVSVPSWWARCCRGDPSPPARRPAGSGFRRGSAAPPTGPGSLRSGSTSWQSS